MPTLILCPHCHTHVQAHETSCPHCDSAIDRRGGRIAATAAAALLGLAATACDKNGPGTIEAMYGAPVTDTSEPVDGADPDDAGQADAGEEQGEAEEPPAGSDAPPPGPPMKPMYGVPET